MSHTYPTYSCQMCVSPAVIMKYGQTLFYCTWLYCASNIILFSQIEGLWQPCVKQVSWCYFSNSVCSLPVSASQFSNLKYFRLLHYCYYLCHGDLCSVIFDVTTVNCFGAPQTMPITMANLIDKYYVCSCCSTSTTMLKLGQLIALH